MHPRETVDTIRKKMQETFKFSKSLSDDEIKAFLGFCENKQVSAGETLWREGDSDNYAAFVVEGKLGIKKKTEFEGKYMIVGTFAKGTVVGELCLLTDHLRSVTAVVLEPLNIVVLSSKNFETLITEHPLLGLKLLKHIFLVISRRLSRSTDRIAKIF